MKPVFDQAKRNPRRVVYAEGESRRVLSGSERTGRGYCASILIGRGVLYHCA